MAQQQMTETVYAAVWSDDYDGDYGCYGTFDCRGDALDYLTDMVFERAEDLGVEVLDSDDWKTVMTREQVRDELGRGHGISLVLSWNEGPGWKDPDEYVSMMVVETEHYIHYERQK